MISNAAYDCSSLRSYIGNVNISYEYKMINNKPQFTITLTNLTNNLMVYDEVSREFYCNVKKCSKKFSGNELKIVTNKTGFYKFSFYNLNCGQESLGSKSVNLPVYNPFYKDKLCKGLESYKQCQRWSGYSANRKKFENDIKQIKEDIAKRNQIKEEPKKEDKTWYKIFLEVLLDYWWLFVIILSIIIALCYFIIAQRKKKEYNFDV